MPTELHTCPNSANRNRALQIFYLGPQRLNFKSRELAVPYGVVLSEINFKSLAWRFDIESANGGNLTAPSRATTSLRHYVNKHDVSTQMMDCARHTESSSEGIFTHRISEFWYRSRPSISPANNKGRTTLQRAPIPAAKLVTAAAILETFKSLHTAHPWPPEHQGEQR